MKTSKASEPADVMSARDYSLAAEIFVSRRSVTKRGGLIYHRFDTAAEAIDFAVVEFSALRPDDLVMTVEDKRFNLGALRTFHRDERARTRTKVAEPAS